MKKSLLILFVFISSIVAAQVTDTTSGLNYEVLGLVYQNNNYYFITEKGLIKIGNDEDALQKYYREIYNDSTIVNPNIEIKPQDFSSSDNYYNPAIDLSQWTEKYNTYGNKLYLYDFMEMDENGNYIFKPGVIGLFQKDSKGKKRK
ncbi:MAG: hypothetical protein A2068_05910 [Ignavibacteria bacterium GWB2_35_6b]|nr:MAG: hypothetical protein A2068_05910 [Ignavibacteria bacterium GWB2_35_6b]